MNTSIMLTLPEPGSTATVVCSVGVSSLNFSFDIANANFSRNGDSLVVEVDGARIVVTDFFITLKGNPLPSFILADGTTVIDGKILAERYPEMDLTTSAEPDNIPSSGLSQYDADFGELMAGIDRIDSLGTDQWQNGGISEDVLAAAPLFDANRSYNAGGIGGNGGTGGFGGGTGGGTGEGGTGGGTGEGGTGEGGTGEGGGTGGDGGGGGDLPMARPEGSFVRAVNYNPGNNEDPVTCDVFYKRDDEAPFKLSPADINFNGSTPYAPYSVSTSIPEGWEDSWLDVTYNPDTGRMEFRLTAEGIEEMHRLGLDGKNLINFVTVSVTENITESYHEGGNFTYNVEFVGTDDPNFSSSVHDSVYGGADGSLGEYHQGTNMSGAYDILSSRRDDEIILNDRVLGGSSIHASGDLTDPGNPASDVNTIQMNQGASNTLAGTTTSITSADGVLRAEKGVEAADQGKNDISMGRGDIFISNNEGYALSASAGGINNISGSDLTIDAQFGMQASGVNAKNDITADTVTVTSSVAGVSSDLSGVTRIAADRVNISSSGGVGVRAQGDGTNTITAVEEMRVSGRDYGLTATNGGTNTVTSTDGSVFVNGNTALFAENAGVNTVQGTIIDLTGSVHAIRTEGADAANRVTATGDVTISGGNTTGTYTGYAAIYTEDGETEISADNITINADYRGVSTDGGSTVMEAHGNLEVTGTGMLNVVHAANGGTNTLSGESVTLTNTHLPNFWGMGANVHAEAGGTNTISGRDVTITAGLTSLYSSGLGSRNTIEATGDITLTALTHGYGNLIQSLEQGQTELSGANITMAGWHGITTTGTNSRTTVTASEDLLITTGENGSFISSTSGGVTELSAKSMILTCNNPARVMIFATNSGRNILTSEDDMILTSSSLSGAVVSASYGAVNQLTSSAGDIRISSGGIHANEINSKNIVTAAGELNLGRGGISSATDGVNEITAKSVTLTKNVEALQRGINSITATNGDVSVNGASTHGIYAYTGGSNAINGKNISVETSGINAHAIMAHSGGSRNVLTATETVTVEGRSNCAIYTTTDASNEITAKNVELTAGSGYGIYSQGSTMVSAEESVSITSTGAGGIGGVGDSATVVTAKDINITVNSTGNAAGVENANLTADSITMTITTATNAHGIFGNSTLTANAVRISVDGTDQSIGMLADSRGGTVIQSRPGHALDLEINAETAMSSEANSNSILGNSQAGGMGDSIRLNGDVYTHAQGSNNVTTGAGNDTITLNGAVSGEGVFRMDGGNGHDVLVLTAANLTEFLDRYADWLNSLTDENFRSIESIQVSGLNDINALRNSGQLDTFFDFAADNGIDIAAQAARGLSALAGFSADLDQHYQGDFTEAQDMDDANTLFGSGADRLDFRAGLRNEDIDTGDGNDSVSISDSVENAALLLGDGDDHLYFSGTIFTQQASVNGGSGFDVLHLDSANINGQGLSLNSLAASNITGFECIDLSGGSDDYLSIDNLLSGISGTDSLMIKGDDSDTVALDQTAWTRDQGNCVENGGVQYDVYANANGEELLIQQGILLNFV